MRTIGVLNSARLSLQLSKAEKEDLDALVKKLKTTRNRLIRDLIADAVRKGSK